MLFYMLYIYIYIYIYIVNLKDAEALALEAFKYLMYYILYITSKYAIAIVYSILRVY